MDKIYGVMDSKESTICIFVDLAEAFDTVNHPNLLETMEKCGIKGKAYNLFSSISQDRVKVVSEFLREQFWVQHYS